MEEGGPIIPPMSGASRLQTSPHPRVGAVSYLNARPLTACLDLGMREAPPSSLADDLAAGRLDLALLPAFSVLALGDLDLKAADGVAIGSDGPVGSVLLYSRRPAGRIRTLAPDPASRSSNALVRILLAERHGLKPSEAPAEEADAVLVIGDAAMKPLPGAWEDVMDLGAAWKGLTDLPFVYALWAGPKLDSEMAARLRLAAERGLRERPRIAREAAGALGLEESRTLDYLTHNIRYGLGEREHEGLRAFARMIRSHGLMADPREPAWT